LDQQASGRGGAHENNWLLEHPNFRIGAKHLIVPIDYHPEPFRITLSDLKALRASLLPKRTTQRARETGGRRSRNQRRRKRGVIRRESKTGE
jgi:hypothetical protein